MKTGNMDDYFTKLSKENEITMEVVDKIVDTGNLVKAYIENQLVQ